MQSPVLNVGLGMNRSLNPCCSAEASSLGKAKHWIKN